MTKEIKFALKVWNTLIMSKGCIAKEVKPKFPENRKWVGIYPLDDSDSRGSFRYFEIELAKTILENDLDWFKDDEISKEIFVDSLEELYKLLEVNKLDPLLFDVPWKCDYPYHY